MKRHGRDTVRSNYKKEGSVQSTSNLLLNELWAFQEGETHELRQMHNKQPTVERMQLRQWCQSVRPLLMALVPLEVHLKGLASDCVRDRHLSMAGSPRTPCSKQRLSRGDVATQSSGSEDRGGSLRRLTPRVKVPSGTPSGQ